MTPTFDKPVPAFGNCKFTGYKLMVLIRVFLGALFSQLLSLMSFDYFVHMPLR